MGLGAFGGLFNFTVCTYLTTSLRTKDQAWKSYRQSRKEPTARTVARDPDVTLLDAGCVREICR